MGFKKIPILTSFWLLHCFLGFVWFGWLVWGFQFALWFVRFVLFFRKKKAENIQYFKAIFRKSIFQIHSYLSDTLTS